ncbi:MAG: selenocysteine-specific translation elongation factor [Terriglobales bacterium]
MSLCGADTPVRGLCFADVLEQAGTEFPPRYPAYTVLCMKSIIVGTAGHIDHGKTALVKALTGIDADRLQEEKRRGITIDLGFAHFELPAQNFESIRIGFIDVPGHEKFVRNMLAGIGGIDLVLLVVAADESIKPQTREHFDICRLLSVRRGITVLTKSDLVDKETLDVVRLEVEEFVRGSFLDTSQSPIVAVSSLTGAGLDRLKKHLANLAMESAVRNSNALPRLPIDRVFTMKGFGTVVTGTLIAGRIRNEDELEVFPEQERVRVRGLQVQGQAVDEAVAGQRTAANLAGVGVEEVSRGMVLTPLATFQPARRLDVCLSLLSSAKPLKQRSRVRFHAYAMETSAEVIFHEGNQLSPGEEAFAQLRLTDATLLLPGDRFIIRQFSPAMTIGGGVILSNAPPANVKRTAAYVKFLQGLKSGSQVDTLRARVVHAGTRGLSLADAVAQTGWTIPEITGTASTISDISRVDNFLFCARALEEIAEAISASLNSFHRLNPLVSGMSKQELREQIPSVPTAVYEYLLESLSKSKKIELTGDVVRLSGRGVVMKDDEAESKRMIEAEFASAGLKVPALKDVLAGLKIDKARAQKIVTLLLRDKTLVKVSDDLVFHSTALDGLRQTISLEKEKSPKIDIARFKNLTGVSRKYAIPLLEYLDREHVTRRVGDDRIIL